MTCASAPRGAAGWQLSMPRDGFPGQSVQQVGKPGGGWAILTFPCSSKLTAACVVDSWVPHSHHTLRAVNTVLLQHRFSPIFFSVPVVDEVKGGADPKPGSGTCSQTFLCRISTSPPPLPVPHLLLVHNCSLCLHISKSRVVFLHPQSSLRLYPRLSPPYP